ncbi:MAG: hypothetical protein JO127_16415 [Caulobacteraceae bacterium]|nr:hypothetical protein [Caulobacteraceae bacterium]
MSATQAEIALFVSGALCAGFAIAAVFFLRFWARTRDAFFMALSAAFWLMAANQMVSSFSRATRGEDAWAYLLRLAAFVIIIVAVLGKNAPADRR